MASLALAPAAPWGKLLGAGAGEDLRGITQAARFAMSARLRARTPDGVGLSRALAAALRSGDAQRSLSASVVLLVVLEEGARRWPAGELLALGDDAVSSGLVAALAVDSPPVLVASALRALCAVAAALAAVSVAKEDRQQRPRRAVTQLRAALAAHPKELLVQSAFAAGCCTLLASGDGAAAAAGQQLGALWASLWPLAVHPHADVAAAASAGLCRLTWHSRSAAEGHSGRPGGADAQPVLSVEAAIAMACGEFEQLFRPLAAAAARAASPQQGQRPAAAAAASPSAAAQCVRLLELARSLVLLGASSPAAPPGGGKSDGFGRAVAAGTTTLEGAATVVLPLPALFAASDLVVVSLFRDASLLPSLLADASLSAILDRALELVAAVAEVAGTAVLLQAQRLRKMLEAFAEAPVASHWRHCDRLLILVDALAVAAPAVLLKEPLLRKLAAHCLDSLRAAETACASVSTSGGWSHAASAAAQGVSLGEVAMPARSGANRRKRKAPGGAPASLEEVAAADLAAGLGPWPAQAWLQLYRGACAVLVSLLGPAAPMFSPQLVATACDQVIRVLWTGLAASPSGPNGGIASARGPQTSAGGGAAAARSAACRSICSDEAAVVCMLDLVEALHRPSCIGAVPLAPNLVAALTALLNSVAGACRWRGGGGRHSRRSAALASQGPSLARHALRVRDAVVASCNAGSVGTASLDGRPAVTIEWPASLAEVLPTPAAAAVAPQAPLTGPAQAAVPAAAAIVAAERDDEDEEDDEEDEEEQAEAAAPADAVMTDAATAPPAPTAPVATVAAAAPEVEALAATAVQVVAAARAEAARAEAARAEAAAAAAAEAARKLDAASKAVAAAAAAVASKEAPAAAKAAETGLAAAGQGVEAAPAEAPLELFPDGDGSELPELCMDSPSSDGGGAL